MSIKGLDFDDIFKRKYCDNCGQDITFDDICEECEPGG